MLLRSLMKLLHSPNNTAFSHKSIEFLRETCTEIEFEIVFEKHRNIVFVKEGKCE